MRRLWRAIFCLSAIFTVRAVAHAQHVPEATGITISCACPDPTGQAYMAAVKETIAKDPHYRQMSMEEGVRKSAIRIHIVSMALESPDGKPHAVLSIVYTHDGALMHQFIETCTRIPIADCAQAVLKDLKDLES